MASRIPAAPCAARRKSSRSVQVDTQIMTRGAAVIAVVVALMGGFYWARWRRSEGSLKSAKALAEGAGKAAWGARRAMLLAGLAIATVIYLWIRGEGR